MKKNKTLKLIFSWGSRTSHSGKSIFFQPCWVYSDESDYPVKYFTSIKEFNEFQEKEHVVKMERENNWQKAIAENPNLKLFYDTFKGSSISIEPAKKEPEIKTLADLNKLFKKNQV